MSLRNTLVVFILLIIVGGYALYLNHQPPPEANPKVYHLDAKDIRSIELKSPDRDIVVERAGAGKWNITKPVNAPADSGTVDSIANQIASLEITGTADEHPTAKPFPRSWSAGRRPSATPVSSRWPISPRS
jgi:hypothetical protein